MGHKLCGAQLRNGEACRQYPMRGGTRCKLHGGASPQARAAAARRVTEDKARRILATYGQKVDTNPVEALLDEVCWTAGHVAWLRERVRDLEAQQLVWGTTQQVEKGATEFAGTDTTQAAVPNVWLDLYQRERTHLVNVCKAAIAAGIEERRVRLAEQQGDLIVQVLQGILGELALTAEQSARVPEVASRHLRLVAGTAA